MNLNETYKKIVVLGTKGSGKTSLILNLLNLLNATHFLNLRLDFIISFEKLDETKCLNKKDIEDLRDKNNILIKALNANITDCKFYVYTICDNYIKMYKALIIDEIPSEIYEYNDTSSEMSFIKNLEENDETNSYYNKLKTAKNLVYCVDATYDFSDLHTEFFFLRDLLFMFNVVEVISVLTKTDKLLTNVSKLPKTINRYMSLYDKYCASFWDDSEKTYLNNSKYYNLSNNLLRASSYSFKNGRDNFSQLILIGQMKSNKYFGVLETLKALL